MENTLQQQASDAIKVGDLSTLKTLLDSGLDAKSKGTSGEQLVFEAARQGQTEIVEELYNRGVDLVNARDSKGDSVSTNAYYFDKNGSTVKFIDEAVKSESHKPKLDISKFKEKVASEGVVKENSDKSKEASDAIKAGDVSKLEALIKGGLDVNSKGASGEPLINEAAVGGQSKIVETLYNAGANIKSLDSKGNSVSTNANHNGHAETEEYVNNLVKHVNGKQNLKEGLNHIGDKLAKTADKVTDFGKDVGHKVGDAAADVGHKIGNTATDVKHAIVTPSAPEPVTPEVTSVHSHEVPLHDNSYGENPILAVTPTTSEVLF